MIDAANQEPRSPHLADWIRLALHTGCRKGELLGLEWGRVDLHQRVIHLEARHNKSKRRQTIPLNEEARNAILSRARFRAQYCPSTPWVFSDKAGQRIKDIKKGFASACRRAGITDFRPHDLRHTCASWLVMRNVPLATVKAVLRHGSIVVTERYAHLAPESARGALALLDAPGVKPASESKTAITSRYRHVGSAAAEKE
nr:site-specific integrase [Gammaproteobacteria bacterium]